VTNLKIESEFCGENTRITGTVDNNGHNHTVELTGSASARGTYATVDGEEQWWCGSEHPGSESESTLEEAIEDIFVHAHDEVKKLGIDTERHWVCDYVDGQVQNAQRIHDDE
jgi:hypothetical protein